MYYTETFSQVVCIQGIFHCKQEDIFAEDWPPTSNISSAKLCFNNGFNCIGRFLLNQLLKSDAFLVHVFVKKNLSDNGQGRITGAHDSLLSIRSFNQF